MSETPANCLSTWMDTDYMTKPHGCARAGVPQACVIYWEDGHRTFPRAREVRVYAAINVLSFAVHRLIAPVLGFTSWTALTEERSNSQVMLICYFRSIENLHGFAHEPLHRKAWDWWNRITKNHPYISITHEVYHAPKGHWENIFINNHLAGIGN